MRHAAVHLRGDTLFVFWSRAGDTPEHILVSTVDVSGDWSGWRNSAARSLLKPERPWEGADLPLEPSVRDAVNIRVNQLRDPAIYVEDDQVYLLYSAAGEAGIGLARPRHPLLANSWTRLHSKTIVVSAASKLRAWARLTTTCRREQYRQDFVSGPPACTLEHRLSGDRAELPGAAVRSWPVSRDCPPPRSQRRSAASSFRAGFTTTVRSSGGAAE